MPSNALSAPPSKIIAVHVSYRSRALQRGSVPAWPSYFLKPPSSLAASDDPVARPPGCGLLSFEGEVALVIGRRASRVDRDAAWGHVAWVTAANDFAVYDLRYADRGGNVRSKGIDGLTPLGPRLLDAREIDPGTLRLRTWKNGQIAQDAKLGEELLFGLGDIVADLSRLMTLEPGDVILTGTPAGSTVVEPGDLVEIEVTAGDATTGKLRSPIVEAAVHPAGVRRDAADDGRGQGRRVRRQRPAERGRAGRRHPGPARGAAGRVQPGIHRHAGLPAAQAGAERADHGRPAHDQAGPADGRVRPDTALPAAARGPVRPYGGGMNAQKQAIEQIRPGEVLVIDARQEPSAGTIGDILALRAQVRGAAGIVTDGAIRDAARLAELDIPTYHAAVHPAVLGRRHVPWEWGVTVACAGVTVQPGDLVVGDDDGVVVLPPGLAAEVLAAAREQERQEEFVAAQVASGAELDGLYPLGERWREAYEAWLSEQEQAP